MKKNRDFAFLLLLKLGIFFPLIVIALGYEDRGIFSISLLISFAMMVLRLMFKKKIEYTSTIRFRSYYIYLVDTIPLIIALLFLAFIVANNQVTNGKDFMVIVYSAGLVLFHLMQLKVT